MSKTKLSRLPGPPLALVLFLLLPLAAPSTAQAAWYQIEIIVFSRSPQPSDQPEHWPQDPGRPDLGGVQYLNEIAAGQIYARLPQSELKLDGAYWSLRGAAGFRPLLHLAWRQPISGQGQIPPVYLGSLADGGTPELEGTLEVSVSRFLHLDLDLVLRRSNPAGPSTATPPVAETPISGTGSAPLRFGAPDNYSYRLRANRRMRSGELHYIDHPLMGALVRIDRYRGNGAARVEDRAPPARRLAINRRSGAR